MNPPQHAAVFCVGGKTAVQALDRLDPVLPLSPGRAERHRVEYYRHETLSLYAALDVKTGNVEGKATRRHTSTAFIAFLTDLVVKTRWAREIHIVLDNLSAPKTKAGEDPKVRFNFTPTYCSGSTSRKTRKYIQAYSNSASFRWTRTDPKRRIKVTQ